jgi:septum formation protein
MNLILGSNSPRRAALLSQLGYAFEVRVAAIDEEAFEYINPKDAPIFLAQKKAEALIPQGKENEVLLCADTLVFLDQQVLGKPKNLGDAKTLLHALSGKTHEVITGVYLYTDHSTRSFAVTTYVTFDALSEADIDHYVNHYPVLDKAGSYGIQDWIGLIGVRKIEGSYTNVMGLPTLETYRHLEKIMKKGADGPL